MKLTVGGCRGTSPVSHPDFFGYGGDTTSFLIEGEGGENILIDAGTGLRNLSPRLGQGAESGSALLLVTHYHLDHLMGLPAMPQLYDRRWQFEIAGPELEGHRLDGVMKSLLDRPFWPLQLCDLEAHIRFRPLPELRASGQWGGLTYRWCAVPHPGGCVAYRIDEPGTGASVVIATDTEWSSATADQRASLLALCRTPEPCRLLLMDGQYDDSTYLSHKGWGHSRWAEVADVARETGVQEAWVIHHDPSLDDRRLAEREAGLRSYAARCRFARTGMSADVQIS